MGSIVEGVKTVNSTVRTVLMAAVAGILGWAGFTGYQEYTKRDRELVEHQQQLKAAEQQLVQFRETVAERDKKIADLDEQVAEANALIERLETSMNLLKTDQRLAQLQVITQTFNDNEEVLETELEFSEISPSGDMISDPKRFKLPGDVVYVDNWVVKFEDEYIEKADLQRGTSLCLFRRIFSEQQQPTEGVSLDEVGMRPQAYARGGAISEFEQQLWSEFWEFANNPAKAREMGIRAANGEAVAIQVREGKIYQISLRSSGGLSITPVN